MKTEKCNLDLRSIIKSKFTRYAILIFMVFILYASSFKHGFSTEDYSILLATIQGFKNFSLFDVFVNAFFQPSFYRPIPAWTFFHYLYAIFGLNPLGYRIVVFSIFCCNAILVYTLLNKLSKNDIVSFIGAVFYITRGTNNDPIRWICLDNEIIMSFFILLALVVYVEYLAKKDLKFYIFSILFTVLAIMSKEPAIMLPLLIFCIELIHLEERSITEIKKIICRIFPFLLIFAICFGRLLFFRYQTSPGPYELQFSLNILVKNLIFYIPNLFNNIVESIIFALIIITCVFSLIKHKQQLSKIFIMFLFIFLSVIPFIFFKTQLYPYYLGVAQIGCSILLTFSLNYISKTPNKFQKLLFVGLIVVFLISGFLASNINDQQVTNVEYVKNKWVDTINSKINSDFSSNNIVLIQNSNPWVEVLLQGNGNTLRIENKNITSVYYNTIPEGIAYNQFPVYVFNYSNNELQFEKKIFSRNEL